jgi:HSP20 family protein
MSLVPWRRPQTTPSTFSSMPELGRFFDDFFSGMPLAAGTTPGTWAPPIAFSETPQAYVLKAELPGLTPDQVDIQVSDDAVVIKGERKEEKKEEKENYLRSEMTYGSFMRRISLPSTVDPEHTEATMDKGVLTIKLPRVAGAKSRSIKVK